MDHAGQEQPNPALDAAKLGDETWSDAKWRKMLESLVDSSMVSWKDIAALTLGHLNPSQVGTSLASSAGFKSRYGKGNTMRVVMAWFYSRDGRCVDCRSRLELQADHSTPREQFDDPLEADYIENMVLRCRRCNVIRRPSHEFGGQTHLTAESALMWILLVFRPRTLADFVRLCRLYGMTMADIRMHEGWAMACWLAKEGTYLIDDGKACNVLQWPDGALTRAWPTDQIDGDYDTIVRSATPDKHVVLVYAAGSTNEYLAIYASRIPIASLPFSHYFADHALPAQALAIQYTPPNRKSRPPAPARVLPLPPRGHQLLGHAVIDGDQVAKFKVGSLPIVILDSSQKRKKITQLDADNLEGITVVCSAG